MGGAMLSLKGPAGPKPLEERECFAVRHSLTKLVGAQGSMSTARGSIAAAVSKPSRHLTIRFDDYIDYSIK
jgi:hypothetical protein